MTFALVRMRVHREEHLGLEEFAARVSLHPDHVRRLVVLGLLDADADRDRAAALRARPGRPRRADRAAARRVLPQLRRHRRGARPAGPHRRTGGARTRRPT